MLTKLMYLLSASSNLPIFQHARDYQGHHQHSDTEVHLGIFRLLQRRSLPNLSPQQSLRSPFHLISMIAALACASITLTPVSSAYSSPALQKSSQTRRDEELTPFRSVYSSFTRLYMFCVMSSLKMDLNFEFPVN